MKVVQIVTINLLCTFIDGYAVKGDAICDLSQNKINYNY